jgi:hypothetical protein
MGGVREGTIKGRIAGNTTVDRTPETGYMSVKQETGNMKQETGNRLQVTGYRLQVTGYRLQVTCYMIRKQGTGNRKQDTGYMNRKKEKETGAGNR